MMLASGTRTFSNFTSACLSAAIVLSCVCVMPAVFALTMTSSMPSSPFVPGLRPTTVKKSATFASRTNSFVPLSTRSLAVFLHFERDALGVEASGRLGVGERPDRLAAGDLRQGVALLLLRAAFEHGQHTADDCVEMNGPGTSARPNSSMRTMRSR